MPLIDRASRARESRADDHLPGIERLGQRIGHWADIAFGRGIEGGAIFEEDLRAALRA